MDAPERGALMFVRFAATGLIGLSILELILYGGECYVHHQPVEILHGTLLLIPFLSGVAMLIKAGTIAEWISNKFD